MPLLISIHVILVVGISLPLAAVNLFFRDVRYLVTTAISLWFFLTPIFYSLSAVPDRYRLIYDLNPNARLIQAYRWALFEGVSPPLESLVWAFALSVGSLIIGYYLFKRMEPYFADFV
jgi:ABC-type polysaccharide/polyol phosphate export permease